MEDKTVVIDKRIQGGLSKIEENDLVIYWLVEMNSLHTIFCPSFSNTSVCNDYHTSSPYTEKRKSIGRVIGCQKDWVRIDESRGFSRHIPVPEGYCWIEDVGPVSMGLVRGKPLFYLWPPKIIDSGMYKVTDGTDDR